MAKDGQTAGDVRAFLRAFISAPTLPLSRVNSFGDDDSFLEKGILDSTGVLEVVGHIEKEYEIRVDADEIIPDNLDSINKLAAFIGKRPGDPFLVRPLTGRYSPDALRYP
jgi:acyl carrier protein